MSAFMQIQDIEGQANDQDHDKWILIESMSAPITRSIPSGAVNNQRTQGETTLGDVIVVRTVDKSSTKLQEACAKGKFLDKVTIHFCNTVSGKEKPYLKYELEDVICTSYSFHGNASGSPLPSEQVSLGFSGVTWTYVILDPDTGDEVGNVPVQYEPDTGK